MKRFPFIKQKDSMQCGVACLASICEYYGKKYYYICNPSKGLSIVNDDEFTVSWLSKSGVGIALLLEPTEKFGLQKEVMTTNRHSLSFILKYLLFVVNKTHFVTDIDFLHLVGIILIHLIAVNNDRARHLV